MAGTQYSALETLRANLLAALDLARETGDFSAYNAAIAATEPVAGLGSESTVDGIQRWLLYRTPGYPALLVELAGKNNNKSLLGTYYERSAENSDRALSAESYASANFWDGISLQILALNPDL